MAHRPTHRQSLAAPEPNPSTRPMDPTLKKSPKPTITTHHLTTQSSDPLIATKKPFFMTNHFSRLNLNHKTRIPQKPTSRDIHLQAKAMTVSADADSSSFSLIKATHLLPREKYKESSKETVKKASKDLGRKKQHQEISVLDSKKHHQERPVLDSKKQNQERPVVDSKKQHRERSVLDRKNLSLAVSGKQLKNLNNMENALVPLGRRRSLGGSQVELGDILANCGVKIVSVDMPPFMQIHAVDCARKTHDSLEKFTSKALALTLKKEFDGVYGPAWHCIVGTSFGSFVTHSVGGFLYFSMDQKLYVLLFKTSVQRAD